MNIWDPAAGSGFAGFLLAEALRRSGVEVCYRGQEINEAAVFTSRRRFKAIGDAKIAHEDSLRHDAFSDFEADLVIVDAPWGMDWRHSLPAVETRREGGEFGFGLPQVSDSTWLFISLALEKLRPAAAGGGRAAALVTPSALSSSVGSAAVRRRIVEAGLLESVTRLPDGLAPNTAIPLYLLTFSNATSKAVRPKAMIADLQTLFTTKRRFRSVPASAFYELESGLRTGKPGPRNRTVNTSQFVRRDARLSRVTRDQGTLSWRIATYNDTSIDAHFLEDRYGTGSGVSIEEEPRETIDLDPSRIFEDDSRELLMGMAANGWAGRRLSSLLASVPTAVTHSNDENGTQHLFVPTSRSGQVSSEAADVASTGRVLGIELEGELIQPEFLIAWLNSEQGRASQQRAIEASGSGHHVRALRSDASSLMRWADELLVPVPELKTQLALATADERLGSFQAELTAHRESIWASPDSAEEVVSRVASAFDDSLPRWLDQLPFPVASALWTAEIAATRGEQQRAYLHAWEAIVTFHATVLLSACRSDPGSSGEIESAIRQTLADQHLGIERASFGTWVVIVEKTSKELRRTLEDGNSDDIARIRRAFADLGRAGIERLISKDVVKKFSELSHKRNRWLGHTGYISDHELSMQVDSLVADLRDLRGLLGNVWEQLLLVRAGSAKRSKDGVRQRAEVAIGTRSPFASSDFSVGDMMIDGELYLVRDGSQSPLPLSQFVQLREAPSSAQFTSYFYNRTEGTSVRMVSYQYGPKSELNDDVSRFMPAFGALTLVHPIEKGN